MLLVNMHILRSRHSPREIAVGCPPDSCVDAADHEEDDIKNHNWNFLSSMSTAHFALLIMDKRIINEALKWADWARSATTRIYAAQIERMLLTRRALQINKSGIFAAQYGRVLFALPFLFFWWATSTFPHTPSIVNKEDLQRFDLDASVFLSISYIAHKWLQTLPH